MRPLQIIASCSNRPHAVAVRSRPSCHLPLGKPYKQMSTEEAAVIRRMPARETIWRRLHISGPFAVELALNLLRDARSLTCSFAS